jgi:hypothetical protein
MNKITCWGLAFCFTTVTTKIYNLNCRVPEWVLLLGKILTIWQSLLAEKNVALRVHLHWRSLTRCFAISVNSDVDAQ